jgi:metacaspase-1
MKYFYIFCVLFLSFQAFSQTKHALLIGVGTYPKNDSLRGKWKDLSSMNDLKIIENMLLDQKFEASNIVKLKNEQATVENVVKEFDKLIEKIQPGDIVFFHYSGHGQQISDIDPTKHKQYSKLKHVKADEEDGYDEALVLYNAPVNYVSGYDFSHHLIDDQIEYYQNKIQERIGKNGHLIMIFDSCHSGSITRGVDDAQVYRSESKKCLDPSIEVVKQTKISKEDNSNKGVLVEFKGCKDDQRNLEIQKGLQGADLNYGSLSYALYQTLRELKKEKATYQEVFDIVYAKIYANSKGTQEAVLDTKFRDNLFFGAGNIVVPNYYGIEPLKDKRKLKVRAGMINGIQVGDSISIYSNTNPDAKLLSGIVSERSGSECTVIFGKTITEISGDPSSSRYYTNFRAKRTYEIQPGQALTIALDISKNKELEKKITELLKVFPTVNVIEKVKPGVDYIIKGDKTNKVQVLIPQTNVPLRNMSLLDLSIKESEDTLKDIIQDVLVVDYFSSLTLSDERINLVVDLKEFDSLTYDKIKKNKKEDFKIYSAVKFYYLTLKNESTQKNYVYLFHLSNSNVYSPLIEDGNRNLQSLVLQPGEVKQHQPAFALANDEPKEGLENIVILTSLNELKIDYLLKSSKSLQVKERGKDPLKDQIKNGIDGKNSKVNTNAGLSLQKFAFKIDHPITLK